MTGDEFRERLEKAHPKWAFLLHIVPATDGDMTYCQLLVTPAAYPPAGVALLPGFTVTWIADPWHTEEQATQILEYVITRVNQRITEIEHEHPASTES